MKTFNCVRLHHVQEEVMPHVITTLFRIVVHPSFIVLGNSHFSWIPIVRILTGTVIFLRPEVLRIIHVRIVHEPIVVLSGCVGRVLTAVSLLLSLSGLHVAQPNNRRYEQR